MTIKEYNDFHKQDLKLYKIEKNKEFKNWYYNQIIKHNYQPCIELSEINQLIEDIKRQYEIKYSGCILDLREQQSEELIYIEDISKYLNFEQLNLRLSPNGRKTLKVRYRSNNLLTKDSKTYIGIKIKDKSLGEFFIYADGLGIVKKHQLHELGDILQPFKGSTTLGRILLELEQIKPTNLDYQDLKKCIQRYQIDTILRDKIIYLAALSLLYSKNNSPEYGYIRAYNLIKEYNDHYIRNLQFPDFNTLTKKNNIKRRIKK